MFDAISDYFVYFGAVYAWCARHTLDEIIMEYFGTIVLATLLMGLGTIGAFKIYHLINGVEKDDEKSKERTSSKRKARSSESDEAGDVVDEMEEQRQLLASTDPLAAAAATPVLVADEETPQEQDAVVYHEDTSRGVSDSEWVDRVA